MPASLAGSSSPDPDPLDSLLDRAVAATQDDRVRTWLAALLVQGEAAGSEVAKAATGLTTR
jgi:hypothetical protein